MVSGSYLKYALLTLVTFGTGCITSAPKPVSWGIQPGHRGFVPARVVVMPCQIWPNGARYDALPLGKADGPELQDTCVKFDEFVVQGFQNQPFMKGFTPKAAAKLLEQAGKATLPQRVATLWRHDLTDCVDCDNGASYYVHSIQNRPEWRQWLNEVSLACRSADAILLPFVQYAKESRFNDRGLRIAERSSAIIMLLVDTNNGQLLWAGGRESRLANQKLEEQSGPESVAFLPWADLHPRLFINAIWKEFPGRQDYE